MTSARIPSMLLLVALAACGTDATKGEEGPRARPAAVVGVSFDAPLDGEVDRVVVDVAVGNEALLSETLETDGATPLELELPALAPKTRVQVRAVAYRGDEERLRQVLMTEIQDGRTLLLPLRMNDECVPELAHRDITCAGSTCRQGVCALPYVDPRDLDDYAASWATPPSGACGAVDAGEPVVTIGEGEPFVPLEDGQELRPYRGLQGGMHFFLSVEASGMHDETAITHYFDKILSTGRESSVLSVERAYEVDGGCHRYELAYVLPPVEVVGETMRLGVNVADTTGNTGHGHVDVVVGEPVELEK